MSIYTVSTTDGHYVVVIEWESEWVSPDTRALHLFAMGAASLREGGPVGPAVVGDRDEYMMRATVLVECLNSDGPKF